MRVHVYVEPAQKIGDQFGAPNWVGYTCIHCGNVSGLDDWQICEIPVSMAQCSRGRKLTLWERLVTWAFGSSINCLQEGNHNP
jgi:hypothetical protein